MKIYLASRYSRHEEMNALRETLISLGHHVTSRWVLGEHRAKDTGTSDTLTEAENIRFAQEDMQDLTEAYVVVCFTEPPRSAASRGGRHVEMGMAIAYGKKVYVVGHKENVFCHLPQVTFCKNFNEFLTEISGDRVWQQTT